MHGPVNEVPGAFSLVVIISVEWSVDYNSGQNTWVQPVAWCCQLLRERERERESQYFKFSYKIKTQEKINMLMKKKI